MPLHTKEHGGSQPLRRLVLVVTATALMLTGLTALPPLQSPAHAASVCTWMSPGPTGQIYNGIIRVSDHGSITWSMRPGEGCPVSFPPGGYLRVRVVKVQNVSGGGCSSTPVTYYSWKNFMDFESKWLASIGSGQCFRLQYYSSASGSSHYTHYGKLYY